MASAWVPISSINSTAVQPLPRAILTVSRVRHRTTRIFKKSVPPSSWDRLHPSHGFYSDAAGFCSLDCHQSMVLETAISSALSKRPNNFGIVPSYKTLPFSVLAQVGYVLGESTEKQQRWRHQTWFGYWIGPEDIDGWGFVEAYLLPS